MDSNTLRNNRLVFYEDLVRDVNRVLREFLKLSGAKCAFLIDLEGHMVTRQGSTTSIDMDAISALVAGSFAATKEMARILGEEEFSVLFHQGKKDNIQLSLVGDRTLLTVIFDDSTTVGMVRLYASQTGKRLGELFRKHEQERAASEAAGRPATDLDDGFVGSAKDKLDDLFGG